MPRISKRRRTRNYIILALVLATIGFFFVKYDYELATNSPVDPTNTTKVSFFVEPGDSAKKIALNLEEEGLINSQKYFYWYLRLNNEVPNLLAGRFMLSPSMNYAEITENITNPNKSEYVITIQEGLRIKDIDEKLVDADLIEAGDFIEAARKFNDKENYPFLSLTLLSSAKNPLEGYLYPDTYFVDPVNFTSEQLIRKMLDNFKSKLTPAMLDEIDARETNIFDVIVMASIIEKEVRTSKDLPIVSGILWKRLNTPGWTLGADATLLYEKDDNSITASDLSADSPYNTRKKGGLPPSAISNPSIESIKAAIYPEESSYWFYLTTLDTGEVIYAKTNEEHNQNKYKHLK